MIPPKIVPPGNKPGSWEHWYEDTDQKGEPVMVRGGPGRAKNEEWVNYHDREHRRFIHLSHRAIPSRRYLVDEEYFGLQAPNVPWISLTDGKEARRIEHARSMWMYTSQIPSKEDLKHHTYHLPTDRLALVPFVRELRLEDENLEEGGEEWTTPRTTPPPLDSATASLSRGHSTGSHSPLRDREARARSRPRDPDHMDTREDHEPHEQPPREESRHYTSRSRQSSHASRREPDSRRRRSRSPSRRPSRGSYYRDQRSKDRDHHYYQRREPSEHRYRPARGRPYHRNAYYPEERRSAYRGSHYSPSRRHRSPSPYRSRHSSRRYSRSPRSYRNSSRQ